MARPKKEIKRIQGDERMFYRKQLQILLNSMYDLQKLRISLDNRLKICKDGSNQKQPTENAMYADDASAETLMLIENKVKEVEEMTKKEIKNMVSRFSEWNDFLKGVKGCGEVMAAVLISQIDIEKITNASKLIAYAGINPGMKKGKKKDEDGNVYETDTLVRGDRPTKGFLIPYNKFLKAKLMGVLADSFIKSKSEYAKYYYDTKTRLENSALTVNGKENSKWSEESKLHIHNAAKRKMIYMFLIDVYRNFRLLNDLPVRNLYMEEYLGRVHHA